MGEGVGDEVVFTGGGGDEVVFTDGGVGGIGLVVGFLIGDNEVDGRDVEVGDTVADEVGLELGSDDG